jgi:hypothetical protein
MRALRTPFLLSLALLAVPLVAERASAQVIFAPRRAFGFGLSNWYWPSFGGPWYGGYPGGYGGYPGYGYGGYPGYGYGGYDGWYPYGYGATFAPYQYTPLTVAYASSRGTYIPSQTYRSNYISATPYNEPSFVRPASYANTYYSSAEDAGGVRAAGYFNGNGRARPASYDSYPGWPPYYGPYCW